MAARASILTSKLLIWIEVFPLAGLCEFCCLECLSSERAGRLIGRGSPQLFALKRWCTNNSFQQVVATATKIVFGGGGGGGSSLAAN